MRTAEADTNRESRRESDMGRALRQHRTDTRASARLPLCAPVQLTTDEGKPVAPLSRCIEIGLGGLRIAAAQRVHDLGPAGRPRREGPSIRTLSAIFVPRLMIPVRRLPDAVHQHQDCR